MDGFSLYEVRIYINETVKDSRFASDVFEGGTVSALAVE